MLSLDHAQGRCYLALGVLSHPLNVHRRDVVRKTWGGNILGQDIVLRFVLGTHDESGNSTWSQGGRGTNVAEATSGASASNADDAHGDVVFVSLRESDSVLRKLLMWVREAVSRWDPVFVGRADDDCYLRLELILPDLRAISMLNATHAAYGSVEWFAVQERSGIVHAWGRNVVQSSNAWRDGKKARRRAHRLQEASNYSSSHFDAPFPFLKGPLAIYSSPLARWLVKSAQANGKIDGAIQPKPTHRYGNGRVMEDVSVGWLLASSSMRLNETGFSARMHGNASSQVVDFARMGNLRCTALKNAPECRDRITTPALTLVDMGLAIVTRERLRSAGGFIELRLSHDLRAPHFACFKAAHLNARVLAMRAKRHGASGNISSNGATIASRATSASGAGGANGASVDSGLTNTSSSMIAERVEMERAFDQLHAHSSRGVGPSRGAFVCEPSQPQWKRDSKGLVLRHADWRYCYFKQVAYCRSELFQKAANVTPVQAATL